MPTSSLGSFKGSICPRNAKAPALAWPMSGASFCVTAAEPGPKAKWTWAPSSTSPCPSNAKEKKMNDLRPILLVEDNLRDVEMTLAALKENHLANEVIVARHGGEALDYLYRRAQYANRPAGHPLAIFLDLKMPKVDGLETLRQIKNDETLKVIPVVMLTSSREE